MVTIIYVESIIYSLEEYDITKPPTYNPHKDPSRKYLIS